MIGVFCLTLILREEYTIPHRGITNKHYGQTKKKNNEGANASSYQHY